MAEKILFVTGRIAEKALRSQVAQLATEFGFDYQIAVLPITVAALMTPKWLLRHLEIPSDISRVILPGYLAHGTAEIQSQFPIKIECGPKDLRDLPSHFGSSRKRMDDYGSYSIQIIAEINHAPRWPILNLVRMAQELAADGADIIDIGCDPSNRWPTVATAVKILRDHGLRVSIDTFDPWEASQAVAAGAELVLSVNGTNRHHAVDWGCEVIAIPDTPGTLDGVEETIEFLSNHNIPFRLDPILEPIGSNFMQSLIRYAEVRRRYPELPMMMGIGNLTELTDGDSAAINTLLLAICEELQIQSILTTQVINWARSCVRECDLARRLVHYSISHQRPPKRIEPQLNLLRDPKLKSFSPEGLLEFAAEIRDNNYRILVQDNQIHIISAGLHLRGTDAYELMGRLMQAPQADNIDESHAFYLGFELSKAQTALQLGKQYEQDQALNWGFLTIPEIPHRLPRTSRHRKN